MKALTAERYSGLRLVALLLLLTLASALLAGCAAQGYDSVTGEKVGGVVTVTDGHPQTNPATGNPVEYRPTKDVDWDLAADGAQEASEAAQQVASGFGPVGLAVAAALGVATPFAVAYLRGRRKRSK